MKEIGKKFREAREKKNISINDASVATKISLRTIQAMESGDDINLPAKSYLRGFVQTYAKYLELNTEEVMKQFLDIHGSTRPKPLTEAETALLEKTNHEEIQKRVEIYKKVAYGAAAVIALVLIYGIHRVVNRYEKEAQVAKENKEVVQSQLGTPGATPTPANGAAATPLDTANAPTQPLATTPVAADAPTEHSTTNFLAPAPVEKIPEKKEEHKKEPAVVVESANPTPLVLKEEKPAKKAVEKPQEIIIEALDNVEIRYTKDSGDEKVVSLKPEQILTIHANSKVSLSISDSGAVNVTHNGHDNGVPGSLGQPIKLNFP